MPNQDPNNIGLLDLCNKSRIHKDFHEDIRLKDEKDEVDIEGMKNMVRSITRMCDINANTNHGDDLDSVSEVGSAPGMLPRRRHKSRSIASSSSTSGTGSYISAASTQSSYSDRYKPFKKERPRHDMSGNGNITLATIERNHDRSRYRSGEEIRDKVNSMYRKSPDTVSDPRLDYSKGLSLQNSAHRSEKINRAKYLYDIMKSNRTCLDGIEYPSSELDDETLDRVLGYLEFRNDVERGSTLVEEGILSITEILVSVCDGSFSIAGKPINLSGWEKKVQTKLGRMKYATSDVSTSMVKRFRLTGLKRILVELLPSGFLQLKQNYRNMSEKGLNFDADFQNGLNSLNDDDYSSASSLSGSDDEDDSDSEYDSDFDSEV